MQVDLIKHQQAIALQNPTMSKAPPQRFRAEHLFHEFVKRIRTKPVTTPPPGFEGKALVANGHSSYSGVAIDIGHLGLITYTPVGSALLAKDAKTAMLKIRMEKRIPYTVGSNELKSCCGEVPNYSFQGDDEDTDCGLFVVDTYNHCEQVESWMSRADVITMRMLAEKASEYGCQYIVGIGCKGQYLCPRNHALTSHQPTDMSCQGCQRTYQGPADFLSCLKCDYHLCKAKCQHRARTQVE